MASTGPSSASRISRSLIERERRLQMKNLFTNLFDLLPPHPTKRSMPELVEHATIYVTDQLRERMEELKQRKAKLEEETQRGLATSGSRTRLIISPPVMDITDFGSAIQVNLTLTATETKLLLLGDIVKILEEEGAQVLSTTFNNVGNNKALMSIHSQAACPRIGIDNSRVHERLKRLQTS